MPACGARPDPVTAPALTLRMFGARFRRWTYVRYIVASVVALATDIALYMGALHAGILPAAAAVLGYSAGIVVHWLLSSRVVFGQQGGGFARARDQQRILFLASALVGLALTALIVGVMTRLGLDPRLAKLIAIAVSFQATYMLRKEVVFR